MTTELLQNGTLKIEAYSFAEFLTEYQEAVLNGYTLDLDTNEHFPQKYGDHLFVILKADQWEKLGDSAVYTELEAAPEPVITARKPRQPRAVAPE